MTARLRLSEDNRRWWTLAAMCFALFMVMLDNTVDQRRAAVDPAQLRRLAVRAGVDDQRLHALLRRAARHRRPARRHLRPPQGLPDRRRRLRRRLGDDRLRPHRGLARRLARRPGRRRGADDARRRSRSSPTRSRPQERGQAIGTWAGVSAIALALGPLVGGWLTEDVTWRAIFFINVPVAAVAIVVTLFATHESRDETATREVDFPGIATLTVGLTALVLALVRGQRVGLGLGPDHRPVRGRGRRPGARSSLIERRSRRADRRLHVLPLALVPGRQRRRVRDLVRDVRGVLLPRALHAEHPRLLAAGDRRALPAQRRW